MRCIPTSPDWGLVFMWGLLFAGIALAVGMELGQRIGRREAELAANRSDASPD